MSRKKIKFSEKKYCEGNYREIGYCEISYHASRDFIILWGLWRHVPTYHSIFRGSASQFGPELTAEGLTALSLTKG